jgi:hypothetical protein
VNAGKLDEAFELGLQAMAGASRAADRDQVAWQVPVKRANPLTVLRFPSASKPGR